MQRCYCDVCGKEVGSGADARYAVRVESRRVAGAAPALLTDADLDGQDDPDHLDAMDELLADLGVTDECDDDRPEPAPSDDRVFDLCGKCYQQFVADPFGRRRRVMSYSAN